MRRLLGRKAVTIIAAIISLTAIPAAGIVATASPALAATLICTANGNNLCVGASSLTDGTAVFGSGVGRDMILKDKGFTDQGYEVWQMVFAGNTSKCVGLSSAANAEVRECSGGNSNYTNWIRPNLDGHKFVNNSYPMSLHWVLASDNHQGDQLLACLGCSGLYINWNQ